MIVVGLDPAPRRVGYCLGDGSAVPQVGAWRFDELTTDLGALAEAFHTKLVGALNLASALASSPDCPGVVVYEAPILTPHDRLENIRRIYGMGWQIELTARAHGWRCYEATVREVKKELAGYAGADKGDMVAAALKCGVALPLIKAEGREDAADAFGVWLIGIRAFAKQHQQAWDRRLYGSRGALL